MKIYFVVLFCASHLIADTLKHGHHFVCDTKIFNYLYCIESAKMATLAKRRRTSASNQIAEGCFRDCIRAGIAVRARYGEVHACIGNCACAERHLLHTHTHGRARVRARSGSQRRHKIPRKNYKLP